MLGRTISLLGAGLMLLAAACTTATKTAPAPSSEASSLATSSDGDAASAAPTHHDPSMTRALGERAFRELHALEGEQAPVPRGASVNLGGTRAYLSLPDGRAAPVPGVVVIHEQWGLDAHIKHWADRMAADGYAAIAVDLLGEEVTTKPEKASTLTKAVDPAVARQTVLAAHAMLASDPRIQAQRRAAIGWGFGGARALELALATEELDAVVLYSAPVPTKAEVLEPLKTPLLAHFAQRDASIPTAQVDDFSATLKRLGKRATIHRYAADHGFANPTGATYDPAAAEAAWKRTRAFLARQLHEEE